MSFAVGNKADDPERRVVLEADARRFADTMHIPFFETSAKENVNVEEVCRTGFDNSEYEEAHAVNWQRSCTIFFRERVSSIYQRQLD